jgi:hypothetical protein
MKDPALPPLGARAARGRATLDSGVAISQGPLGWGIPERAITVAPERCSAPGNVAAPRRVLHAEMPADEHE